MDIEEQYDKLYRFCWYKLRDRELAEDICQESFLRLLQSDTYKAQGKALQYLYTTARNLCIDQFRKKKTEQISDELSYPFPEEETLESLSVKKALGKLSEEEREILLLRYVNEVPISVLSAILGISRFALYRRAAKAVENFKKALREEDING